MFHDAADNRGALVTTALSLPEPATVMGGAKSGAIATITNKAVGPARQHHSGFALRLGAVVAQERRKRQAGLKLDAVHGHG